MSPAARLSAIILVFCCVISARGADRPPLERGTAIIDPLALRELDHGRFGLTRIMQPSRSADTPLTNAQLFALPSMAPVQKALDADFERYVARHKAEMPNDSIGVGTEFAFQLFDRADATDRQLQAAVENNLTYSVTVEELAFLCNMSLSTFKRRFARIYGTSPNKWLLQRRMQQAILLLQQQAKPSEIYFQLGYENHSSFSQSFKQAYGITPREFQRMNVHR